MNLDGVKEKTVKNERHTRQKETVLAVFEKMLNHPTAEMVCEEVAKNDNSIGRATVYRVLNMLVKNGLAIKVPVYDGADRYDITTRPHFHAKCRVCGGVSDVTVESALPDVKDSFGFVIEGALALYYGVCPRCKAENN